MVLGLFPKCDTVVGAFIGVVLIEKSRGLYGFTSDPYSRFGILRLFADYYNKN